MFLTYIKGPISLEQAKEIVKKIGVKKPDLVVLIDLDPLVALKRKKKQKKLDSMEIDLLFQKKVRARFLEMYKENFYAKKWIKIDGKLEKKEIINKLEKFIF